MEYLQERLRQHIVLAQAVFSNLKKRNWILPQNLYDRRAANLNRLS